MKTVLTILFGYFLHMVVYDLYYLSYEIRFTECVVKMHKGIYPQYHPKGGHYCLGSTREPTLFETIAGYRFGIEDIYNKNIGMPKLSKAYKESKK